MVSTINFCPFLTEKLTLFNFVFLRIFDLMYLQIISTGASEGVYGGRNQTLECNFFTKFMLSAQVWIDALSTTYIQSSQEIPLFLKHEAYKGEESTIIFWLYSLWLEHSDPLPIWKNSKNQRTSSKWSNIKNWSIFIFWKPRIFCFEGLIKATFVNVDH